ncbi:GEVED domain-containing protein [Flavobacterium luteum]|uniref:T9SS type A sorting domain-containing protein n=1 Tax=Flavobacterium luteum TaxID=2026654 RepID=A0A7J5ADR2_9FLAO|nr:GEVED domain-containing protein [Flavobacterium luteum]KAB1155726.1 T9SS type A sorting domain-containing protein [Flavobacterium luteum]
MVEKYYFTHFFNLLTKYKLKKLTFNTTSTKTISHSLVLCIIILVPFLYTNYSYSQSTFVTSGTWICPQGVTSIQVEAWGGGGGGGGASNTTNYRGAGGGGGAYQKLTSLPVLAGQSYTVTIGSGGIAGTITANGGAGGNSTFMLGASTLLTANGGGGGQTQTSSTIPIAGVGGTGTFIGGNGFIGTTSTGGGGGGSAGTSTNGNSAINATGGVSGTGGTGTGGNGGACGGGAGGEGCPGANYGGAGGGGNKNKIGGAGASGYVKITFTCPINTIAAAGSDQTLIGCSTTSTLAGNTPTYGTGTWTLVSGTATINSPNSPTSTITGLTIGSSAILRWTIDNGRCGSTFDDVVITSPIGAGCWTYCAATATNVYAISSVSLNSINNAVVGTTGYENFTSISTNLTAGYSYTITVSIVGVNLNTHYTSVWFDWNNNGIFDISEETQLGTNNTATNAFTTTINVPITAFIGATRMRVINRILTGYAPACGTITYGQIEDYTLNIIAPPSCTTPTAQATALVLSPSGTSLAGSFTAASPAPNNYLVVINTTGTTPTPTNGATYTIGSAITGGTVVDVDSDTSFVANGLTVSTAYYIFVFSFNSLCTGVPLYLNTSPLNSTTTTLSTSYCIPTGNLDCTTNGDYIGNVTINTLNNSSTCSPGGYINYSATLSQTTTLIRGNTFNLNIGTGPGNKKHGAAVWFDFNKDGDFIDAGEYFLIGNNIIASSTNTIAITIPVGATLGATRMRVRYGQKITVTSSMPCTMSGSFGETEDYTITIADPIACVAPTAQPTSLILSSTGTTISGSFTPMSPAPNNYLVVINTSGTTPSPSNGTNYTIGSALTGGTVVDNDSNTTFIASSLTISTTYYFFIFSYNSICTGGTKYNLLSPLTGNVATIASNYCTASVTNGREDDNYLSEVNFIGTLNDISNFSTFSGSPLGYQDFTGLTNISRQSQGEGVNVSIQALFSSYTKAWVDWNKDGDFDDTLPTKELVYDSGTISTGSTTFGFVIPLGQALGSYRIRIRVDASAGGSPTFLACGNINNGGETEDYLFTVVPSCNSQISSITDGKTCGSGIVVLNATSSVVVPAVSEFRWYSSPTGSTLVGTTPNGTWTTPSVNSTTTYYVTAFNGCESLVRTPINAIVNPVPNVSFAPSNPISCGEDVGVQLSATGDLEEAYLINEKFNSGLGSFTNTNITTSVRDADTAWQNRTSTYIPTAISGVNTWYPAISSGINGNKFAMATSDFANAIPFVHNQIASSTVSTLNFINLSLSIRLYYSRYFKDGDYPAEEYITIDVSTNNGANWIEIKRFTEDIGIGTRFETLSYDLSSYVGVSQFKVRVKYFNNNWCDGIALDDIKLFGNRPNVDFNWTTTIPAFTDAPCTIAYDSNNTASTIYVKPTFAQLELGSFNFTVNALLDNGCTKSQVITVTNNSKVWQGGSSVWDDNNNWKPIGKPTSSNCIIIPDTAIDPIISGTSYNAFGKNITIKSGAVLTINTDNNISITDEVVVKTGGIFDLKNSASLVQINDNAINSGDVIVKRTSRPMFRWDYVYHGSPIAGNIISQIPIQYDLKYKYVTNKTITGVWTPLTTTTAGEGFITRVKNIAPYNVTPTTIDFTYTGVPNNGIISTSGTTYDGGITTAFGNSKLLANPYPCAVDATLFLDDPANKLYVGGTIYLWTSTTVYSGTGSYNVGDYVTWNKTGGTLGLPPPGLSFNGTIASGQGFMVQMIADGPIVFKNYMRTANFNNAFYRLSKNNTVSEKEESHRIWLNISNSNAFRQTLVGYIDGATNEEDRSFDGMTISNSKTDLYSILDEKLLNIQGRALPFDENDSINLGYKTGSAGNQTIAIDHVDGIFTRNQGVYLEDKVLNTIHNLKNNPYEFTSGIGTFNNRFILRYTNPTLGVANQNIKTGINAFIKNKKITIQATSNIISISIFDLTGKLIKTKTPKESLKQFEDDFLFAEGIYLAKIKLDNNSIVTKKLIN